MYAALLDKQERWAIDLAKLNEHDFSSAKEINLLRPVQTAIMVMREKKPTVWIVDSLHRKLLMHFTVCGEDLPLITETKTVMAKQSKDRNSGTQNVLNVASALDLRFNTFPSFSV